MVVRPTSDRRAKLAALPWWEEPNVARPCRRGQQLGDALLVEGVFVRDSEAGGVIFEDRAIGLLVAGSRSEHYL